MDRIITATVAAPPDRAMTALADLGTYPSWLPLVTSADPADDSDDAVWHVTLRARLGPLARSKRLRMRRTHLDAMSVRFERCETDGRSHADWTLNAAATTNPGGGSQLSLQLHYGGALWSAPIEGALAAFEEQAAVELDAYLAER